MAAIACLLLAVVPARAFSLLGPFAAYQATAIGYNLSIIGVETGGPMNLSEEYRWNVPTLNYAFDSSFLNYFGQDGVTAVTEAMTILNAIPGASSMTPTLTEFPLSSKGPQNFKAGNLGILDLRSTTLGIVLSQMGLGNPERWTWCLRDRQTPAGSTNYLVVQRNFDPVTWVPTNVVNGTLYTYEVHDPVFTPPSTTYADAIEMRVDSLATEFTSVAGVENPDPAQVGNLQAGEYYTGITRDDAGGLRYLLRRGNFNIEATLGDVVLDTNFVSSPFGAPPGVTNSANTNVLVATALRPGIDKVNLSRVNFDSLLGTTFSTTNQYTDSYVTNGVVTNQVVRRIVIAPDIVFTAADLGTVGGGSSAPFSILRTTTSGWTDNSALNTVGPFGGTLDGPGVIQPSIQITFSRVGPHIINSTPFFLREATGFRGFTWGYFDTTTIFAVFPNGTTIQALESQVGQ